MREHQSTSLVPRWTGRKIGDYQILRHLGSGGMAEVYLAEQCSLGRRVAWKVLHPHLATDASYVQRFCHEARAAASLVHPNIVQIYEVGAAEGVHFIAQEYVSGQSLADVLQRQGACEPSFVGQILQQIGRALVKAEALGIIHRDIKPENILLSPAGEVKIADFGLARVIGSDALTQVGVALGTPLYMSPEQIEGRTLDVRSDIYALGVTGYYLLAGRPPFTGETPLAIAVQHLQRAPARLEKLRPDIPGEMAGLVHQMLAKNPAERPGSPTELLQAVARIEKFVDVSGDASVPRQATHSLPTADRRSERGGSQDQERQRVRSLRSARGFRLPRRLALGIIAGGLLGAVVGVAMRPRFMLSAATTDVVPHKASAAAQLFYAKRMDTEAAWLAAVAYDRSDPFIAREARKGLIRCYLLVLQEDPQALRQLRHLQRQLAMADEAGHDFVWAGLCIAQQRLGNRAAALAAHQQLDARGRDRLRRSESQLYQLLQTVVDRLLL